SGR
ncbi:hypothetical protein CFC21_066227, partial [Triticum aestivum]